MTDFIELIKQRLSEASYKPSKTRELARKLQISQKDYPTFRRTIKNLIDSGQLAQIRGNRITLPVPVVTVVGQLTRTKSGLAFVAPEDGSPDIEIDRFHDLGGLHGDRVEVRITGKTIKGVRRGAISKIVEARTRQIVGTYHHTRYGTTVKPDDRRLKVSVNVSPPKGTTIKDGAKVVVLLLPSEDPTIRTAGQRD